LANRLACVSATGLGSTTVPEENCTIAMSPGTRRVDHGRSDDFRQCRCSRARACARRTVSSSARRVRCSATTRRDARGRQHGGGPRLILVESPEPRRRVQRTGTAPASDARRMRRRKPAPSVHDGDGVAWTDAKGAPARRPTAAPRGNTSAQLVNVSCSWRSTNTSPL
jgi:hypothetical protein